jgi:hypothetical protein
MDRRRPLSRSGALPQFTNTCYSRGVQVGYGVGLVQSTGLVALISRSMDNASLQPSQLENAYPTLSPGQCLMFWTFILQVPSSRLIVAPGERRRAFAHVT